jgi:hypothetical protein
MKLQLILAAAVALSATAAYGADGTFDRTLAAGGAPNVSIATGSGYIHVSATCMCTRRGAVRTTMRDG